MLETKFFLIRVSVIDLFTIFANKRNIVMASKEHILTLRRYILLSFVLLFNMYVHASLTVESREVEMSNDSLIIDSLNYDSPILSPNTTEEPYSPLDIYLPPSPQSSSP